MSDYEIVRAALTPTSQDTERTGTNYMPTKAQALAALDRLENERLNAIADITVPWAERDAQKFGSLQARIKELSEAVAAWGALASRYGTVSEIAARIEELDALARVADWYPQLWAENTRLQARIKELEGALEQAKEAADSIRDAYFDTDLDSAVVVEEAVHQAAVIAGLAPSRETE